MLVNHWMSLADRQHRESSAVCFLRLLQCTWIFSLSWNSMALESLCNRPPQISRSLLFDQDIKFPDFKLGNMTIKICDDKHSTNLEPSTSSAIVGPLSLLIHG